MPWTVLPNICNIYDMVRTYITLLTIYCCWILHMIRITNHIERQVCTDVWSSIKVAISSEKWRTAALNTNIRCQSSNHQNFATFTGDIYFLLIWGPNSRAPIPSIYITMKFIQHSKKNGYVKEWTKLVATVFLKGLFVS